MAELGNMDRSDDPSQPAPPLQAPDQGLDSPLSSIAYRPVSILAVIGFGASVLYAAIVSAMALVAFLQGRSMFWSLATLLIPVLTTVLSAIGYFAVQRSEGTRAGGKLAQYGMVLSILVALLYIAYYAGVFFAVRSQALDCADKFFLALKDADVDQAFRLSLPPEQRPASEKGSALRLALETEHNVPSETIPKGPYNQFKQDPLVFFISQGGNETKIEALGTSIPEYSQGSYVMKADYRITTPEGWFHAELTMTSTEGGKSGKGKREWRVSEAKIPSKNFIPTPLGQAVQEMHEKSAGPFARTWLAQLRTNPSKAIVESLPQSERLDLAANWLLASFAGASNDSPCVLLAGNGLIHASMIEQKRFNTLLVFDEDALFPGDAENAEKNRARRFLALGCWHALLYGKEPIQVGSERTTFRWHRLGEQSNVLQIDQDLEFSFTSPAPDGTNSSTIVQVTLVLEGNASVLDNSSEDPDWHIVKILVTHARLGGPKSPKPPVRPR